MEFEKENIVNFIDEIIISLISMCVFFMFILIGLAIVLPHLMMG